MIEKLSTSELWMRELIDILNDASRAYYTNDTDVIMSDAEYDKHMKELIRLEKDSGIYLPNSPTSKVGYEETDNKIKHLYPILSLHSTKSTDDMLHFLGEKEGVLSWKLDGMSIVLYYDNGVLVRAVSRGDGHYGKDITKNVLLMRNVPQTIRITSPLIARGEGCLSLKDFEQIKKTQDGERYGNNSRNLASGLINNTKSSSLLLSHLSFIAHSVIFLGDQGQLTTVYEQFSYLESLGFYVVPHSMVLNFELHHEIDRYTKNVETFGFPVDGLVLALDDVIYGESLGGTARYPKHSIAFKWPDISVLSTVTGVHWSVSRTGLITPIVTFAPVEIDGTIVKQANLHNLRIFEELQIGIGDMLKIYKANKIIPEVEDNLIRSNTERYPEVCPVCGDGTIIISTPKTRKLYCYNCRR